MHNAKWTALLATLTLIACKGAPDEHGGEHGKHEEHASREAAAPQGTSEGHEEHAEEGAGHGHEEAHGAEHGAEEEGVARISEAARLRSSIALDTARAAEISQSVPLSGRIALDPRREAVVRSRVAGRMAGVRVQPGDRVRQGQVVATIESDATLENIEVAAPRSGVVLEQHARPGEVVAAGQELLHIADLSQVQVELRASSHDLEHVRSGAVVDVRDADGSRHARTRLSWISPVASEAVQTVSVRAPLENRDGSWRPGIYVTGELETERRKAALTVDIEAIQVVEGDTAVFVREGEEFKLTRVRTGLRDARRIEIRQGLAPGAVVAAANSFIVKAELGKGEAGHDH